MPQKVIVTGATRGIGKAICEKFTDRDFEVIGLARKKDNVPWSIYECDVSNSTSLEAVFNEIVDSHGTPHILINNAGTYLGATWDQESLEQYDQTMSVNARAVFQLSQLFAKRLIAENQKGAIVNVSSVSGRIGSIDPAYAASKAAVDALTKSFARGLAKSGIRVNAVSPGPVNTDLASNIPEDRKKEYVKSILQGRFGEPEEIANLVFFLANNEASLLTGEVFFSTGGIL